MIQIFATGSQGIGFAPDRRVCARRLACKFDEFGAKGQGRKLADITKGREDNQTKE